jgi:hypothetical protein
VQRTRAPALASGCLYAFCELFGTAPAAADAGAGAASGVASGAFPAISHDLTLSAKPLEWLARQLQRTLFPQAVEAPTSLALQLAAVRVALRIGELELAARWAAALEPAARAALPAPFIAAWSAREAEAAGRLPSLSAVRAEGEFL